MSFLKQSTAATIKLGPFCDQSDGFTAEVSLTISQADIRLSKNGGAFAQSNNAAGATHDENGYYGVPLDTTDTNTLGRLRVAVNESGALPVWADFTVLAANVFDSLIGGGDYLQVDAVQVEGADATDALGVAQTGDAYARVGAAGASLSAIPWNAAWDAEVQSEAADALVAYDPPTNAEMEARTLAAASYATAANQTEMKGATFDTATDSLEAIRNRGDAAWTGTLSDGAVLVSHATEDDDGNTLIPHYNSLPLGGAVIRAYRTADWATLGASAPLRAIATANDDGEFALYLSDAVAYTITESYPGKQTIITTLTVSA